MSRQDTLSPEDSRVLSMQQPPPTPIEPPALGELSEGPAQGESRIKSFVVFSPHNSAPFLTEHESNGKYLFSPASAGVNLATLLGKIHLDELEAYVPPDPVRRQD